MVSKDTTKRFNKLTLTTIIAVYILILIGGIVRSAGAGMGCPDWPRCFGRWSPPASVAELPADYKEQYAAVRQEKNLKFARYLDALGFSETAGRLREDKSVLTENDFDPVKSWIEYANRLVGVAIGFFIIAVAYRALKFRTSNSKVFWTAFATLVAVIFQGWFGSIVVSTNLTTWTVTVHMFIAMAIVCMLIYLFARTSPPLDVIADKGILVLTLVAMLVLVVQVFFGTEVRAAVDRAAASLPRSAWLESAGFDFFRHRAFSWTVLVVHVLLFIKMRKTAGLNSLSRYLLVLTLGTFLTGAGMQYMDVPAYLQPVHLLLATLTFGVEALVLFRLIPGKSVETIQSA